MEKEIPNRVEMKMARFLNKGTAMKKTRKTTNRTTKLVMELGFRDAEKASIAAKLSGAKQPSYSSTEVPNRATRRYMKRIKKNASING